MGDSRDSQRSPFGPAFGCYSASLHSFCSRKESKQKLPRPSFCASRHSPMWDETQAPGARVNGLCHATGGYPHNLASPVPRALPRRNAKGLSYYLAFQAVQRLRISVALVPPKPKLLLITVLSCTFSRVCCTTGRSATSESSSSILAEPAMKLPSIISRQ